MTRVWRAYRHTTTYPAYKHTSFNLVRQGSLAGPRTTIELSFHIKYRYADGGFWVGFRPEVDVHRYDDRLEDLGKKLQNVRMLATCWRCGREEWGEPGLGIPDDWQYVHTLEFCDECCESCTLSELMVRTESERNNA